MEKKKIKFISYRRLNGHDEFLEFYNSLPKKDRAKLNSTITAIIQVGIPSAIQMEWVKKIDSNLFEIRSKMASNIQRGIYFHAENNNYIITHGFTKKTQKTPKKEIKHAKELRAEYYERKHNHE